MSMERTIKKPTSIGFRQEMKNRLESLARKEARSLSNLVEILIEEALARRASLESSSQNADKRAA